MRKLCLLTAAAMGLTSALCLAQNVDLKTEFRIKVY